MLVLSREKDEKVVINGPCVITVVKVKGKRVRLGFEPDDGTSVVRQELLDKAVGGDHAK